MGNLLLDASSPAIVWTGASTTVVSGSFTAPAGARLVIAWVGNTGTGDTPAAPSISGGGLSYTLLEHCANPDVNAAEAQAAMWTAVSAGAAHTVTVVGDGAATGVAVKVWVWTDDSGATPGIGADKENARATSGTSVADSVTATVTGSRGVICWADWNAQAAATAGTGCTLTGGGSTQQSPTMTYAFALRTTADGVSGNAITMDLNTGTTDNNRWVIAEVTPVAAPQAGNPPVYWWPGAGPNRALRFRADPRADSVTAVTESAVTIDPAVSAWAAVAVAPVPQPVALSLTAVTSTWAAQTVVASPVVPVTPATAVWASVPVSPAPGQVAATITPAVATWSAITVAPAPQPVTVALTPATGSWTAVPVSPVPGATAVTITPATAAWVAQPVSPAASGTVGLVAATTAWRALPGALAPGQTARTITPATATWSAVAVSTTPSTGISPALCTWAARPVAPAPGVVAVTITPAAAVWSARVLGLPVTVALVAAGSTWAAVPMSLAGAGEPGHMAGTTRKAGAVADTTTAAGGAYATGGARIDGDAAAAGKVDGNVL